MVAEDGLTNQNMDFENPTHKALLKDADSRTKGIAGFPVVTHPTIKAQRVYCFLCGKPAGYITQDSSKFVSPTHVIVSCDRCDLDIITKYGGKPPNAIPTELYDAFGYVPEQKGE